MVFVAQTKYVKGIGTLEDTAPALTELPIKDALSRKWDSDAHFVTYTTHGPRYRKPIAELKSVKTEFLVFDCDNENHNPWQDSSDVIAWFDKAATLLPSFYTIYTTRSGGRIILYLKHALEVRAAEGLHSTLVKELRSKGLNVDPNCSDWPRMFRLPFVVRDGAATWKDPFVDCVIQEHKRFTPASAVPHQPRNKPSRIYTRPQPGPEARELIWID